MTALEAAALLARGAANLVKLVEHCLAPSVARDGAVHADVCHVCEKLDVYQLQPLFGSLGRGRLHDRE